ncbi:MAG: MerR family transcriptional regulator [Magnetococcales bacterium]|nr:MerR family transcriptional regulator [Magnetococcales bacterium]MBF0156745.1 MerR family transcriptional regulator [Magnetococcales bacterium]
MAEEMVKIGVVAKQLGISIRTIHMYEREGLVLSYKNPAGTRYFTRRDVEWLLVIRAMIKSAISIAGIRRLLALIPCWERMRCAYVEKKECPAILDNELPCWANHANLCWNSGQECRDCPVYEMRFSISTMKSHLDIRMKPEFSEPSLAS